jgi:hypothetical protein
LAQPEVISEDDVSFKTKFIYTVLTPCRLVKIVEARQPGKDRFKAVLPAMLLLGSQSYQPVSETLKQLLPMKGSTKLNGPLRPLATTISARTLPMRRYVCKL